jgi:hypothetical protein
MKKTVIPPASNSEDARKHGLPKLTIEFFGHAGEDVSELEQSKFLFIFTDKTVMVDGQKIDSYDELVRLAGTDEYRNRKFIEVVLLPTVVGG